MVSFIHNGSKSYFYSYTYEKTYLVVQFTKGCFFVNFLTEKLWVLGPKYYLLTGDTAKFQIFSLHKIKMSKQHRLFILYTIPYI